MTISRAARPVLALALLLAVSACAERGGTGSPAPSPTATADLPADDDALVLQVEHVGGFVTPGMLASRLPLVTVYADGRVITEGPVIAIYPGPALPNVQVTRIEPDQVQDLADRALAAGVGETGDLGSPPVADLPSTRFTLNTDAGPVVREVYALLDPDSGLDPGPDGGGVTEEQATARARLWDLQTTLTDLGLGGEQQPYTPEAVAAVVLPWMPPEEGVAHPDVVWPGPPLPGDSMTPPLEAGCVIADGEQARAVLDAAASATTVTPWLSDDGTRWSVTFRPLLPHETGCDDLIPG